MGVIGDGVGVDLGHHQRNLGKQAPSGTVVDDISAFGGKQRRILLRGSGTRGENGDVGTGFDGFLHSNHTMGLALENNLFPHRFLGGGNQQFINLNLLLIKNLQHL